MKTFGRFVALAAFAMACVVCMACSSSGSLRSDKESHKRVSQVLNLGYFSRVESYTSYDVKFVQGKTPSVRVVGAKGLVERLSVQRSGETLVIKVRLILTFSTWRLRVLATSTLTAWSATMPR